MDWQKFHDQLYYVDGTWRDIYVPGVEKSDWEKWVDFVNENYPVEFYNGTKQAVENKINFAVVSTYWNGQTSYPNHAAIHLNQIKLNCHFFSDTIIKNDFDPKSVQYISDYDAIINYLKAISHTLEKEVFLCPENMPNNCFLSVKNGIIKSRLNK